RLRNSHGAAWSSLLRQKRGGGSYYIALYGHIEQRGQKNCQAEFSESRRGALCRNRRTPERAAAHTPERSAQNTSRCKWSERVCGTRAGLCHYLYKRTEGVLIGGHRLDPRDGFHP